MPGTTAAKDPKIGADPGYNTWARSHFFFFCTTPVSRSTEIYSQEKVGHILHAPSIPLNPPANLRYSLSVKTGYAKFAVDSLGLPGTG